MTLAMAKSSGEKTRRVLVVDDQADVREALRLLLKSAGYASATVETPKEALTAIVDGDYDLVVIDMNYTWDTTSGEEGLRLLDRLRAVRRDIPVIAMTGWSTIELAVRAMHHGACDFIPKPWDNRNFLAVISKHLAASAEGREAADAELEIARKVQRKLLPQPHFSAYGLECECLSLPAGEIGGDLYDFFEIDEERMAFLLGDVSGKGIGAALLVANLQATIRGQQGLAREPAGLMERVNQLFFQATRPEHYATLFFGVYETKTRMIKYVNCGHPAPLLIEREDGYRMLEPTATVLGAFQGNGFEERSSLLEAGERLVLYSDGFSEAGLTEQGGDGWALDTIRNLSRVHQKGLAAALVSAATALGKQADDITVLDIRSL